MMAATGLKPRGRSDAATRKAGGIMGGAMVRVGGMATIRDRLGRSPPGTGDVRPRPTYRHALPPRHPEPLQAPPAERGWPGADRCLGPPGRREEQRAGRERMLSPADPGRRPGGVSRALGRDQQHLAWALRPRPLEAKDRLAPAGDDTTPALTLPRSSGSSKPFEFVGVEATARQVVDRSRGLPTTARTRSAKRVTESLASLKPVLRRGAPWRSTRSLGFSWGITKAVANVSRCLAILELPTWRLRPDPSLLLLNYPTQGLRKSGRPRPGQTGSGTPRLG